MNELVALKLAVQTSAAFALRHTLPDGEIVNRPEYQTGWNDCVQTIYQNQVIIERWIGEFDHQDLLADLLDREFLRIELVYSRMVLVFIQIPDVYMDHSPRLITNKDVAIILTLYREYDEIGIVAWERRQTGEAIKSPYNRIADAFPV